MESPLPNSSVVLLVQLAEGKDPVSAFDISFYCFYLKVKISFIQTGAVKNSIGCVTASKELWEKLLSFVPKYVLLQQSE